MTSSHLLSDPLVKELLICGVCSQLFEDPRVMPCQHTFCLKCLQQQFQTSHASSRLRTSLIRCPVCFTSAPLPLRGISNFPIDNKVLKVKELVESVMLPGILRKNRLDVLEGRNRGGAKSRPSSWTGDIDVLAEAEALNATFPKMTEKISSTHNSAPVTKEVSTDTNDDLESNSAQNETQNCSNFQELGTQTEICDITKYIGYEKNGKHINKNEFEDEVDMSTGQKRTNVPNTSIGSHSKRTYEKNIQSTTTGTNGGPNYKMRKQEDTHTHLNDGNNNGLPNGTDMDSLGVDEEVGNCDTLSQDREENNDYANSEDNGSLNEEALKKVYIDQPKLLWSAKSDEYNMPTSVVMTSNGNTIVSEYGNAKLQFYESDGNYLQSVDQVKPFALALDRESNIVVGDRKDKTIKVFHPLGELFYEWEKESFHWISGIAVTSHGNFVIFDREHCKIGIYTSEGEKIHEFGHYGDRDSQLSMADFLTVDAHDRILICDSGHHCVKLFDLNGSFLGKFGERGTSDGYLLWPKSVCVDASDNILVSDQRNGRINLYSPDGHFIQTILSSCTNLFNIGFQAPNRLAVTSFALNGHSEIKMLQI